MPICMKDFRPEKEDYEEQTCKKCGCTQNDACCHPEYGNCWWVEEDLCSHCGIKEISSHPATEHPVTSNQHPVTSPQE